jgi:Zn-dependent peptidase ImmA (M78 family)
MNLCDGVDFSPFFKSPEELAKKVLQVCFKESHPTYPINPFEILKMFNIPYQFRKFDNLEGIYIVPDDSNDLPLVGINIDRPITRQRFTAAHEICHHIKDRKSQICPLDGRKNTIEKFADKFAAELLMPSSEFFKISQLYVSKNHVDFDNIFAISDYFGVSFEASVYKLAYKFNLIKGDIEPATLKKRISQYRPENKRISLGLKDTVLIY